jgi:DNA-binding XRE family transcriptional regulator
MSRVKGKCSACGMPLELNVTEPFAGAELAAPLGLACTDCQVLDGGGAIHELKKVRETAGLTLAAVSKRTGMDQATLSRLENGRQPNPTVDTLWRYARAVGRQLVLTHADAGAKEPGNGKAARSARR